MGSHTCSGRRWGSTSGNTSCMSAPRSASVPSGHRGPLCSASASLRGRAETAREQLAAPGVLTGRELVHAERP